MNYLPTLKFLSFKKSQMCISGASWKVKIFHYSGPTFLYHSYWLEVDTGVALHIVSLMLRLSVSYYLLREKRNTSCILVSSTRSKHLHGALMFQVGPQHVLHPLNPCTALILTTNAAWAQATSVLRFRIFTATIADPAREDKGPGIWKALRQFTVTNNLLFLYCKFRILYTKYQ